MPGFAGQKQLNKACPGKRNFVALPEKIFSKDFFSDHILLKSLPAPENEKHIRETSNEKSHTRCRILRSSRFIPDLQSFYLLLTVFREREEYIYC
jgi:hypothetical protein